MATIKGLLGLFFRGGTPPPTPAFVQYTVSAPYIAWGASSAATSWMAGDATPNWTGGSPSGG